MPGSEAVQEGYTWRKVLASYVHLHFGGAPELAGHFVQTCQQVLAAPHLSCTMFCSAWRKRDQQYWRAQGGFKDIMLPTACPKIMLELAIIGWERKLEAGLAQATASHAGWRCLSLHAAEGVLAWLSQSQAPLC